jgi:hypothetical protein
MAKQIIGIGTVANDGTGDPLRTGMDKVNDNFTELYTEDTNLATVTVSAYVSSQILVLTDNLKLVTMTTSGASTITVPPFTDVAFPLGALILVAQYGAGAVSIVAGSGVTINSADSALTLTGQYAAASLIKTATNTWLLTGSITT